jgi:dUTP pyrophosphatase
MTTRDHHVLVHASPAAVGLPEYASKGAAGADLRAASAVVLDPGCTALVPTGISLQLPPGVEAQVRPRSGLAMKHGITVLNAPGTIDSDYRGEVKVLLVNHGRDAVQLERGDRIAQLVLAPVLRGVWLPVDELDETERGAGGFGSTGRT